MRRETEIQLRFGAGQREGRNRWILRRVHKQHPREPADQIGVFEVELISAAQDRVAAAVVRLESVENAQPSPSSWRPTLPMPQISEDGSSKNPSVGNRGSANAFIDHPTPASTINTIDGICPEGCVAQLKQG